MLNQAMPGVSLNATQQIYTLDAFRKLFDTAGLAGTHEFVAEVIRLRMSGVVFDMLNVGFAIDHFTIHGNLKDFTTI